MGNFMNNFRSKMYRFMQGRYGVDQFNRFLFGCSIAFLLLSIFAGNFMYVLALACLIYSYFRMLSRNTQKRYKENLMYVGCTKHIRGGSMHGSSASRRERHTTYTDARNVDRI